MESPGFNRGEDVKISYYFGTTYMPEYADQVGVSQVASSNLGMVPSLLVLIAAMAAAGMAADRFGVVRTFRVGLVLLVLITVPLMRAMEQGVLPVWGANTIYLVLGVAPALAPATVLFARQFPVRVRVLYMGMAFTLGVALFGGTFLLMAQGLEAAGHLDLVPWVAAVCAAVSFGASFGLRSEPTSPRAEHLLITHQARTGTAER